MENEFHDRSVGTTPDFKRREKGRTSILKPPKQRFPFQDLSALQTENELTATTTAGGRLSTSKRVSFAASQVKEFRADANVLTMWGSSYYEDIYRSSDSSHQTDSSNSDGHITSTGEATTFFEDSRHQPLQKENSSPDDKEFLGCTETETNHELNLRFSSTLPSSLQKKMLRSRDDFSTNINIHSNRCSRDNLAELEDKCLQVGGTDVGSHYSPQNPFHSLSSRMNTGASSHIERHFHEHIAAASDCDDDNDELCRPAKYFKLCAQSMSPTKLTFEVDDYVSSLPNKEMFRYKGKDVIRLPDTERESRKELHCISTSSAKEENSDLRKEKKILPLHKAGPIQLSPRNVSPKATFNSSPPFLSKDFFFPKSMSPSNSASFAMSAYNSGNVSCQSKVKNQMILRHGSNVNKSGHNMLNVENSSPADFSEGGTSFLKNVEMPLDTTNKVKPKSLSKKQDIMFSNIQRNVLMDREGLEYLSSSVQKSGINSEDSYRNMELTEAPGNILHVNKSKYYSNSQTSGSISEFTETCGNILGRSQPEADSVTLSAGHRSSAINDRVELIHCQPTDIFKATLAQKPEVEYSDSRRNDSTKNSGKHVSHSLQNMRTFNCMDESMELTETPGNILDISQARTFDQCVTSESTVDFTEAGGNIFSNQVKIDDVEYPSFATKDKIKLLACQQTQELNGMFSGRKELHFSNKGGNVPIENARSCLSGSEDDGILINSDICTKLTETSRNIMDVNQTKNYNQEITPESIIEFTETCGKIIDKNQIEVDHMSLSHENQSVSGRINYQVLKNTSNGKQQSHASNKRRNVSLEKSKQLSGSVNTFTSSNRSMEMTEAPGNILEINQTKNLDLSKTENTVDGDRVDADHLSLSNGMLLDKNNVSSEQKPVIKDNFRDQMVHFTQKTNIENKPAWQLHALSPEKTKLFNCSEESTEMTEASPTILDQSQIKDCDSITPDSSIEFTEAYGKIIGRNQTETDCLSESADSRSPSVNIHPNLIYLNQKQSTRKTQFANKDRNVSIDSAGHLLVSFRNMQTFEKSDRSMEVTESPENIIGANQTKYFDCSMAESTVDFTETYGVILNRNQVKSEHILPDDETLPTFGNRMILIPCKPQLILNEKTGILHAPFSSENRTISENARHQHLSDSVSTVETLNCSNRRLMLTDAPGCILQVNRHITPETSIELTEAGGNIFDGDKAESDYSLPKECQSFSGDRLIASQRTQLLTDDSCRKQEISCLNKRRTKVVETTRQQRNIALINSSDESSDFAEAARNILDIRQTKNCNQSVSPESVMEFTKACGNILAGSGLDHVPLQIENQSSSSDEKGKLHSSQTQVLVHSLSTEKTQFSSKSRHCMVETAKSQHQSGIVGSASTCSDSEKYSELSDNPENILASNQSQTFSHSLSAENAIEFTEARRRALERNEMEVDLTSLSAEGPSPIMPSRTEFIACQPNQKLTSNVEQSDVGSRQRLLGSDFNLKTLNSSDRHMKVSETFGNIVDGNITTDFNHSASSENSTKFAEVPADTSQKSSSRECLSVSDESMEFTMSGGRILIVNKLSITNMDNSALCDASELEDKYQQEVGGNLLNCDKNLDDNQMSVVGAENVELTEDVICNPVNTLNHVSTGRNVGNVDVSDIEVTTSGGGILIGNNMSITNTDNSALCDASELEDDKYQQDITGDSLNCDKNVDDDQMSVGGAENVELTENVICNPVNTLIHISTERNVSNVDVSDIEVTMSEGKIHIGNNLSITNMDNSALCDTSDLKDDKYQQEITGNSLNSDKSLGDNHMSVVSVENVELTEDVICNPVNTLNHVSTERNVSNVDVSDIEVTMSGGRIHIGNNLSITNMDNSALCDASELKDDKYQQEIAGNSLNSDKSLGDNHMSVVSVENVVLTEDVICNPVNTLNHVSTVGNIDVNDIEVTSGERILIGNKLNITNMDNSALCDASELKDDKYQQEITGNSLNSDKSLGDNHMSVVSVENVELTENVICNPVNTLNHVSTVGNVDVNDTEVTSGERILIGNKLNITNLDNSALCDTSDLKDDKCQQEISGDSLNCDKNSGDNQMSVVGAENVELTEDVICNPVNTLNHVSTIGDVDVNDTEVRSRGRIPLGNKLNITNLDNSALCDTSELKDDKYQQEITGGSLNCDKNSGDNQMSVVGAENVELTEDVICNPVNTLNHVSTIGDVDVNDTEVRSRGRIPLGNKLNITNMDNSALCDTSELKDDKYQQEITGGSLNCDKNSGDNQMSVVGAENVELTEDVICNSVNILNHVLTGKNVCNIDVKAQHSNKHCDSPTGLEKSQFLSSGEENPPSVCQIASTVIDDKVCVAEISSPAKKKIKLWDNFLEMDKEHVAAGDKNEMKYPLSNGSMEPFKVSPNNANENDLVAKEVSCSNGKNHSDLSSEENEFSTVTNKCIASGMVVSESYIGSEILITDKIKMQDSYLIVNEAMDISQPQEKVLCKNGNAHSFNRDKSMELTSASSSNRVKDYSEVSLSIEDPYLKIDISIQKELDFEEKKMELKDVSLDDNKAKSLCKDQVSISLEKNGTTSDKQEGSLEVISPKPEILKENREEGNNTTSSCKQRSRNNKRPKDDMSTVSEKQQGCDDYSLAANPVVESPSLKTRLLSFEKCAITFIDISESEGPVAKRMCVNSREDESRCDHSREAGTVLEDTASAQQMLEIVSTDREVTSSREQMCVTSTSQDVTSNGQSCAVNENEDSVSAKESCVSSSHQDISYSLFREEKETKNTHVPSTSALKKHELSAIHGEGDISTSDEDLDLFQENQFLLCDDNDASNKFASEFLGKSYISGEGNNAEISSKIHNVESCDTVSLEDGNWLPSLSINIQPETSSCPDRVCVNGNIDINSGGKKLIDGGSLISTPVVPCTSDSTSYKQHVEKLEDQPSLKANSAHGEMKEDFVENLIRESTQRKDCMWKIKSLSTQEWIFEFLGGTLQLIINLDSDNVSSIYIVSHADMESSIMQLAHRYLQNKLTRDYLIKVCHTSSDVPNVLKLVEHSVKYSQQFIQAFDHLEFSDTAQTDGKSVTFDIANLEMHRWFYVSVDLSSWAGHRLHPEDINVKTLIGKIDQDEVRMLMKAVPMGPWFLRDFAKQVHWYVEECLKNLEKPCVRDTC